MAVSGVAPAPAERAYREVGRHRGLADVRTLAGYTLLALAGLLLATVGDRTVSGFDEDLVEALDVIPDGVVLAVVLAAQVIYLILALAAPLALLVTRRFGALGRGTVAILLGQLAFGAVTAWLGIQDEPGGSGTGDWPPTSVLAAYTAVVAVLGHGVPRRWRRALWGLLAVLAVLRIVTASAPPLDVVLAVAIGGMVGSLIVLAFGRRARVLTADGVASVLGQSGLTVTDVDLAPSGAGGRVFTAASPTGPIDVKVIDEQGWYASRLQRTYRRLRFRDVGDDTPFSSPQRTVAAEAMLALLARSRGVRVPQVLAVSRAPAGEALLAAAAVTGTPLDEGEPGLLTDAVLEQCWGQIADLRGARIAHRDLHLGNLVLGDDGRVWVRNLGLGETAATDALLAGDVAEVLAATSARVGAARAVAAAERVLGPEPLADAVSRLVPPALTAPTRAAVKEDGLKPLVDEVCRVTGVTEPTFADVERIKPRALLLFGMIAVAVYFLAPQLTDLPGMLTTLRGADLMWLPAVLLASAATYAGAALGLAGGTPGRIPVAEAGGVALASSFVATFSPPGVGQVGLNIRYLQKRGFTTPVAVSASSAKEAAVVVVHLLLLAAFAVWAGSSGALAEELDRLPPAGIVAAVAGAVLVLLGVVLALPRVRAGIRESVVPAVRSSMVAMRDVVTDPAKLVTLFAGVTLLPLGYAACLFFSLEAFGGGASFAAVGLVSLTAGSVATAAPTPGGIGAVEAVLLAALTGLGIASAPALAAVFLYRLATFWLPIAPGALAFRALTRREVL